MRTSYSIPGGIHPPENKTQSLQRPISHAGIPPVLVLPLAQHIGAPAKPLINIGDKVLKGQKIAEANGFVSAPIHAPSSGTVSAIENHIIAHPSGLEGPCISIHTDGKDTWCEHSGIKDYTQLDKNTLLDIIRNAGITGMGGAGFPTAVKLAGKPNAKIKTLIINGTECEPYITADDILMRERSQHIIAGIHIIAHLLQAEEILIGIEDNKPEAIDAMQKASESTKIEVISFPTKYPSGGEKQLIQILTGQEVPSGGLPSDLGIVLQNVGTALAVYNAVALGEPLISRITTVTGEGVSQAQNFEVLLGTPIQYLLEQSGFKQENTRRLIMGGPMMGFALETSEVPVVKTTNCVLAPSKEELPDPEPQQACIRCSMCVQACPASLLPQQMYWFSQGKELEKLEAHNVSDCIECGACSYVCPSNIPLVQYFRSGKSAIKQAKQDAQEAEHAKLRFEARKERLEREQAEKEAKRLARQTAAKKAQANKPNDAVAAAMARVAAKRSEEAETKAKSNEHSDPVQDAIARAQAKRSGNTSTENTTEKLNKLTARLAKAEARLSDARDKENANIEAFEAAVVKLKDQIDKLQSKPADNKHAEIDPVQAAIERAKAKRSGRAINNDVNKVDKLKARLAKAEQRLNDATTNNDTNIDAFKTAVDKLKNQLTAIEHQATAIKEEAKEDPVQAAINKAKATRLSGSKVTPEEKIQKLQVRLSKAKKKLVDAKENNDENINAYENAVTKLEQQITALQSEEQH